MGLLVLLIDINPSFWGSLVRVLSWLHCLLSFRQQCSNVGVHVCQLGGGGACGWRYCGSHEKNSSVAIRQHWLMVVVGVTVAIVPESAMCAQPALGVPSTHLLCVAQVE
jgi:hypothetical protein